MNALGVEEFYKIQHSPTLFGRKTENCFTSGPSIFEVDSGKSTVIKRTTPRRIGVEHRRLSHGRSFVGNAI